MGLVMASLPMLGHLPFNVAQYGRHATETPLPLRDSKGVIVFPGFPADTLVQFRLYSVAAQILLWSVLGLTFGPMAERLLAPAPGRRRPAPVPAVRNTSASLRESLAGARPVLRRRSARPVDPAGGPLAAAGRPGRLG